MCVYGCIIYIYVIRTHIRMRIFVNINNEYPLQHTLIIVTSTTNTRIVKEDSSHVLNYQTTRDSISYVIICDTYKYSWGYKYLGIILTLFIIRYKVFILTK